MILKLRKILFSFFLLNILSVTILYSQLSQTKATRQSSLEAFSKGDYEKAYNEFSELLLVYSKDPLYRYYAGVCLVKLQRKPEEAVDLLSQALKGAAVVRTLPSDAMFYLARAQQMSGMFGEAADSYRNFAAQAGKKTSREMNVDGLIQQCEEGKGRIISPEPKTAPENHVVKGIPATEVIQPVKAEVKKPPVTEQKPVEKIESGYDIMLDEALSLQFKADSVSSLAEKMKTSLPGVPDNEKAAFRTRITATENLASSLQKSADLKYDQAQKAMAPVRDNPVKSDNTLKTQDKPEVDTLKETNLKPANSVASGLLKESAKNDNKIIESKHDTVTLKIASGIVNPPVLQCFEIVPAGDVDSKEKIVIDGQVPQGLIYRIQLAVFRNPVAISYFKGIRPVYGFRVPGTDKTNYYAGIFRKSADASRALAEIKKAGFKDAFIISLNNGKAVSADRANLLEKDWDFISVPCSIKQLSQMPADTVTPELVFRVEVTRSAKPLKAEVTEDLKKLAGNRGLDILNTEDNIIVYLIGKFITFESAAEYADLLIRNGYREAKVTAYMGNREIPVETARQLFENLE